LSGMVGLVDLLLNRADLPVEVRNVLRSNHRIVDARAALNPAGPA
jgi:cation transport regulator ChaB